MSLKDAMNEALDAHEEGEDAVQAESADVSAEADVDAVGPIGVTVRGVRVKGRAPDDLSDAAEALPDKLRALGEEVEPTEVDPKLGGARFRTRKDDMHEREFFEVELDKSGQTDIRRQRVNDAGDREQVPWSMTRDQLGRLLDDLS